MSSLQQGAGPTLTGLKSQFGSSRSSLCSVYIPKEHHYGTSAILRHTRANTPKCKGEAGTSHTNNSNENTMPLLCGEGSSGAWLSTAVSTTPYNIQVQYKFCQETSYLCSVLVLVPPPLNSSYRCSEMDWAVGGIQLHPHISQWSATKITSSSTQTEPSTCLQRHVDK